MANYYISGVWEDDEAKITSVTLHLIIDGIFCKGVKTKRADVLKNLLNRDKIWALLWDYEKHIWIKGPELKLIKLPGTIKLPSVNNNTFNDALDNLISYKGVI